MTLSDYASFAAIAGVVITFLVLLASVIFRIGKLTQSVDNVKSTMLLYKESLEDRMEYHRTTLALQMQSLEDKVEHYRTTQAAQMQSLEDRVEHYRTTQAAQMQSLEERMNHNHEILRADIQRLFDAMASHAHDTDGNIIFRVPPPTPQAEPESSPAD